MRTIKEALEEGSLSLEDEIDYDDTPQAEEIALLKLEIERLNGALQTHEILLKSNVLEIERLNNIINEFDKWLEEQLMYFNENNAQGGFSTNVEDLEIVKDKLQELKGSDK